MANPRWCRGPGPGHLADDTTRHSHKQREALFDEIEHGPTWETTINFRTGESTTKRIR